MKIRRGILQGPLHEGPAGLGARAAHFRRNGNGLRGAGELAVEIDGGVGFICRPQDQAVNPLIPGKLRQVRRARDMARPSFSDEKGLPVFSSRA